MLPNYQIMKTWILCFVSLLILSSGFAQENNLEEERDRLYQDYMLLKDTMTSRSWINMVNLAKKLEAVVQFDNVMLDSLKVVSPGQANLEERIAELTKVKDELILSNTQASEDYANAEKTRKGLFITTIILGALLLILVIILIIVSVRYRRISMETENHMADTLKLKQRHKEETDALKNQIENMTGEIELMENNALAMKKSFDVMKSEQALQAKQEPQNNTKELEEIHKELEELSSELTRVIQERDEFEESLGMANLKLAHQIDLNKKFEADLENFLGRLKGKPKTDQD